MARSTTVTKPASEHEAAWRGFVRAHALLVREFERQLRIECDLTLNTYDVLLALSEAPGKQLRMRDLADALAYSTSGVTRVVDGLERNGLAERAADPHDRRVTLVVLTATGAGVLRKAAPVHQKVVNQYWTDLLTPAQAKAVRAATTAVCQALGEE